MYRLDNLINDSGFCQSTRISQLILLSSQNLSQNTPHNLARSSLGQVLHNDDTLGSSKRANCLTDLEDQFFGELRSPFDIIFQ